MVTKDPKLIAVQFNDCINRQDLKGLASLMTDDHTFIDREGKTGQSKKVMIDGWSKFFKMFPGYKNTFERVQSQENVVMVLGHAFWSDEQPHDPVIWTAVIEDDLVREWRVHSDTAENRRKFGFL